MPGYASSKGFLGFGLCWMRRFKKRNRRRGWMQTSTIRVQINQHTIRPIFPWIAGFDLQSFVIPAVEMSTATMVFAWYSPVANVHAAHLVKTTQIAHRFQLLQPAKKKFPVFLANADRFRETCVVSEPGSSCESTVCQGTYDQCVDVDGFGSICTTACTTDAQCPGTMRRCQDTNEGRVCIPNEQIAQERCSHLTENLGFASCNRSEPCEEGTCYPSVESGVCLPSPSEGICPLGTEANVTPSGTSICIPNARLSDLAGLDCDCLIPDEGSLFDDALSELEKSRCELTSRPFYETALPDIAYDPFRFSWTDRIMGYWPAAITLAEKCDCRH